MPAKKDNLWDFAFILTGSILYATAVNVFTVPANIAPGGATGLSVLLNHLFGLPVGVGILLINLPLFILSWQRLGKRFLFKTVLATAIFSVVIDMTVVFLPAYRGNPLLAALYGGVLSGLGLSFVLLRGATTGGSDIAAKLLVSRFPALRVAPVILAVDALVIVLAAVVYRNIDSGLYACLMIVTATTVMDRVLYRADMGKLTFIITKQGDSIAKAVLRQLQRGCTVTQGIGAYSGAKQQILLCVTRRGEVWRLKQLVSRIDPHAFIAVCEAGQVLGEGFSVF